MTDPFPQKQVHSLGVMHTNQASCRCLSSVPRRLTGTEMAFTAKYRKSWAVSVVRALMRERS